MRGRQDRGDAGDGGAVLFSRPTRGLRRPSLDARSEDNPTVPREGCAKSSGGGERVGRGNGCSAGFSARGAPTMKQWSLDART
jgi:hypothetical protein